MILALGNNRQAFVYESSGKPRATLVNGYGELTPAEHKKAIKMYYKVKKAILPTTS